MKRFYYLCTANLQKIRNITKKNRNKKYKN